MFENVNTLGDDAFELDNSFAPVFSSTQESHCEKRQIHVPIQETSKKIKLDTRLAPQVSPFIKKPSFENRDNSYSSNNVGKRIFPGPAGLLGDPYKSLVRNNYIEDKEDFLFCSQDTLSTFVEGPWKVMKDDFSSPNGEQLFEKYTIRWIKKNYTHKKVLENYKTPFLAAVVQTLDTVGGKIPCVHVTLKDTTGIIDATILYSFYKENLKYLTTGSVIVLKQIGVLTSKEEHCLTITANNLLVIYHVKDQNSKENPEDESIEQESVEKIVLQHFTAAEIWKEANSSVVKNSPNVLRSITSNKPQFSNIYSNYSGKNIVDSSVSSASVLNLNNFILPTSKVATNNPVIPNSRVSQSTNTKYKKFDFRKSVQKPNELINSATTTKDNVINSDNSSVVQIDGKDSEFWKTLLEDIPDSLFDEF